MNKSGFLKLQLIIIVFNVCLGGWSVDCILSWLNKDIPFIFDIIIGLFTGQFTVPIVIVGRILKSFGVF